MRSRQIVMSGAGIAGLTAAIAFAERGFAVRVFEHAPVARRGRRRPPALAQRHAHPRPPRRARHRSALGGAAGSGRAEAMQRRSANARACRSAQAAEQRWKAPYLVAHRADLQERPAGAGQRKRAVSSSRRRGASPASQMRPDGVAVSVERDGKTSEVEGLLFVGADGVWSTAGTLVEPEWQEPLFRRTGLAHDDFLRQRHGRQSLPPLVRRRCVTTFLHPGFHLVAYPIRAGAAFNLVAFTPGASHRRDIGRATPTPAICAAPCRAPRPQLVRLVDEAAPWTAWPLHTVDASRPWTTRRQHRADWRRRARHDALRGTGCGDGDRGRRDAGERDCRRLRPAQGAG